MYRPIIFWGDNLDTQLDILAFDHWRSMRRPRPEGKYAHDGAGLPMGWQPGWDYDLAGDIRWIPLGADVANHGPRTGWSGGIGVQDFVEWAQSGNTFRLIPDREAPEFFVDGVSLREPVSEFTPDIERAEGTYSLPIMMTHPTVDLGLAMRGLMFEYVPGRSLTDPVVGTFGRVSGATYRGKPHSTLDKAVGASVAAAILRDRAYSAFMRIAMLEGATRNQLITSPEDFTAWTDLGTPVLTGGQSDPFGATNAYIIDDNDAAADEGKVWNFPASTFVNTSVSGSIFIKAGTASPSMLLWWRDVTAGTTKFQLTATWSGGIPTVSIQSGSGAILYTEPWGNGWHRVGFRVDSIVTANANEWRVMGATSGNTPTGTALYFGANVWDAAFPSSYQGPTLSARNADGFSWAFTQPPQKMFLYVKLVDLGTSKVAAASFATVATIGDFGTWRHELHYAGPSTRYVASIGKSGNQSDPSAGVNSVFGDTVETMAVFDADANGRPSCQHRIALNGGSESASGVNQLTSGTVYPPSFGTLVLSLTNTHTYHALVHVKVGALNFNGQKIDTIAKARAV